MTVQPENPATVPRDDLRRHVTAACRRWKRAWDNTSTLPSQMVDEIIAAADAYALAYARDCLAAVRHRAPGDLAGLIEELAGQRPPYDSGTPSAPAAGPEAAS
jgi:hypothetical protein